MNRLLIADPRYILGERFWSGTGLRLRPEFKVGRGRYRRFDGPAVTLRNAVLANDMVDMEMIQSRILKF